MAEFLARLALANIVASAAIVLVLLLRRPVRRAFGARIAYGLWALPLTGVLGGFLPAPVREVIYTVTLTAEPLGAGAAAAPGPGVDPPTIAFVLWSAGAAASLAWLALGQARFLRDAARGLAGPAVAGVLRPRVVTPADFAVRYTPREQAVVMAHEAMHLERQDARVNALAALARCLNWFNPLIHFAVFHMRADQELACDAQVVARHPRARRTYAEAMLKTQLAGRPLPLGCYWPGGSDHPLTERIAMLTRRHPGPGRAGAGLALVAALAAGAGLAGWAVQPARTQAAETAPAPLTAPRPAVVETPLAPPPAAGPHAPRTPAPPAAPANSPDDLERVAAETGRAAAARALAANRDRIAALAAEAARKGVAAAEASLAERRRSRPDRTFDDLDATIDAAVERALAGLDERIEAEVERATRPVARMNEEELRRHMARLDERMKQVRERLNERLKRLPPPRLDRPMPVPQPDPEGRVEREACTPAACDPALWPLSAIPVQAVETGWASIEA